MVLMDSFSLSYDVEFFFVSGVKYQPEFIFLCVDMQLPSVVAEQSLPLEWPWRLRPSDCKREGLFLDSQFYPQTVGS